MHKSAFILLAAAALSGCNPTPATTSAPATAQIATANPPITAMGAVTLFDAVCGESLPAFETIDAKFAANGVTGSIGTATRYSTDWNASFQSREGPGFGTSCSMVFATKDTNEAVIQAVNTMGQLVSAPIGLTGRYRDSGTVYILDGPPTALDGLTYHKLILISER